MACTSRSALEYVSSARLHLVTHLRDISVILENLYRLEVFCDEEVSTIQAEKHDYDKARKILDSVTKKGEKACYQLLRVIDMMTRRKTSGRGSSLPETTTEASPGTPKFSLPHWISCYPFKEEADIYEGCLQGPRSCHNYQAKLKTRARKQSSEFWTRNKKLLGENHNSDLCYHSLVLDTKGRESSSKIKKFKNKKSKMSRRKKFRTYVPEDKANISPSNLLKTIRDVFLVGKPGIGKTALCHEIVKLWAERENRELDYMFYFDMRETSHFTDRMSLEELLFSVYSEPDEGKEEVLQDIKKHSDNVTVVFDGLTDLSSSLVVKRIVEKDLLPNAKVILTCRPDDEDSFSEDFLRVEVKGFSEPTIKNYFSVILGEDHKKILSQLELFTLCHVPMYALMVAACFLSKTSEDSPQPCSMTEIYINIVRFCLQMSSRKKNRYLNRFIQEKKEKILSLAELAFHATNRKTVNLTDLQCEDSCVLCFLKPLVVKVAPTETRTMYAFLHYTVQEFFAALWLLKNPHQIKEVFQQCLTEEGGHMKHLIPFMCRLLSEKSPSLLEHLIPAQEFKHTSSWFFEDLMSTFYRECAEDSGPDVDLLFLCQCLYESQCPAACASFLETLDYHLDLRGESLDSYHCCAVANVVTLSKERKVGLNLEGVSVSEQGLKRLFGCLDNVLWCDPLPQQLWKIVLLSEGQLNDVSLFSCDGNQFCLPHQGEKQLFERAADVIQKNPVKVNVCLHWDSRATTVCPSLSESLLKALPCIESLSFRMTDKGPGLQDKEQKDRKLEETKQKLLLDLCLRAALQEEQSIQDVLQRIRSLFSVWNEEELIFDLYQHIKSEGALSVIPKLRLKTVFGSTSSVWIIDLSERKTSILLEVLKLQPEKKPVELLVCSGEESEVRTFLQCLPYISQLSFSDWSERGVRLCGSLFCAAAERDQQTGENTLELLASLCSHQTFPFKHSEHHEFYRSNFLLDLYSYIKDYETKTGLSVLPSLQSVLESTPSVWFIDLSERKTSILLEVLKLQPEKKPVELRVCSGEESEVRTFLQCLPYISQLRFSDWSERGVRFCGSLFCAAAERDQQTGENTLELLASLCSHQTFLFKLSEHDDDDDEFSQFDFLLDLASYIKDYETKTGLSVLPSLQSVLESTPSVWIIDLPKTKTSILLEVLKLQPEKKHVELWVSSYEESEVRTFLQCLPYISQLSFSFSDWSEPGVRFCGSLFCAAAERDQQTGENKLELLASLCSHQTFPLKHSEYDDDEFYQCDFLLDLASYIKDYETKTGLSVLPSLQSVLESTPSVWIIDLPKTKTSILLEVLKLQPEKKHVELWVRSYKKSEVRTFLQCLPYISQLRFSDWSEPEVRFCGRLFCAAAERDQQTGENTLELLASLCSHQTFPFKHSEDNNYELYRFDFLLGLASYIKDYETKTGLSVLPSLQSVLESAPSVWIIDLSERKTSILLEVLKLQPEKKPVELRVCSGEESEVRTFLQCLPYISQLSCGPEFFQRVCSSMTVRSKQLASLLQLLGFILTLTGELRSKTCKSVGRVLGLCGPKVDLILRPRKISVRGASLLFKHTTKLHSLRLSSGMALFLCGWVRRERVGLLSVTEELSLSSQTHPPSERRMLRVVSSLASLLRSWTVRHLDLTESRIPAQGLIPLLLHHGPLTIKLSPEVSESLLTILHEVQDKDLTRSCLSRVSGDLTPVRLNWELLHLLLESSPQTVTVNLRKNRFLQESFTRLLPFLDRLLFQRLSPSFVLSALREIYTTRHSSIVPSLLKSFHHEINLTCREMDREDCAALLYTLRHSDGAKLNLMWTSIPAEEINSILFTLDQVSHLSADRDLLLRIVRCCAASVAPQERAVSLLRSLQHRLDLSCSSHVKLSAEGQRETLCLSVSDCRAISTVLTYSSQDTELQLQDCEVEDRGLDLLFPVLDRVRLRASKVVLLQLVSRVPLVSEWYSMSRTKSLCRALGGELDFSHTKLDQTACGALALMLDHAEELTELDLSDCQLTDQLLVTLIEYLHKVQVLDLSHNKITDESAPMLLRLLTINPNIETVRLFRNQIVDRTPFRTLKQFEIW